MRLQTDFCMPERLPLNLSGDKQTTAVQATTQSACKVQLHVCRHDQQEWGHAKLLLHCSSLGMWLDEQQRWHVAQSFERNCFALQEITSHEHFKL